MRHRPSVADRMFQKEFEGGNFLSALGHREHVRLAYTYLSDLCTAEAIKRVRRSILNFLRYRTIDRSKYHETITQAWMMAVKHFMEKSRATRSSTGFLEENPRLLDSKIMRTHYSSELLFSDKARAVFVEPDRDPIPRYDD